MDPNRSSLCIIFSDDANLVLPVNYEYDVAYVLSDWGYHKTSSNDYTESGETRIVVDVSGGQIDKTMRQ